MLPKVLSACMAAVALVAGTGCSTPTPPTAALPGPPSFRPVSMREYSFGFQKPVQPGRIYFRVRNSGTVEHQLRLVRIPSDMPPLREQLSDQGLPRRVVDTLTILPPLEPGMRTVFAADLRSGRYAFLCFLEEPGGFSHAMRGMHAEFEVGPDA